MVLRFNAKTVVVMIDRSRRGMFAVADQLSKDCLGVGPISQEVRKSLSAYFADLNGDPCCDLYQMVMQQVESPLLEVVMRECNGNQTKAADALGINRGTLRKKLRQYGLEN